MLYLYQRIRIQSISIFPCALQKFTKIFLLTMHLIYTFQIQNDLHCCLKIIFIFYKLLFFSIANKKIREKLKLFKFLRYLF